MKILLETNVLISAFVLGGKAGQKLAFSHRKMYISLENGGKL